MSRPDRPLCARGSAPPAYHQELTLRFGYSYDTLGKLLSRSDTNTGLSETFGYDSLNRLTSTSVNLSTPLNKSFTYDIVGNLTSKSDVGTYSYPAPGQPRPHGVTAISGGLINTTFSYDAKGNMTSGNGLSVGYATYDKPSSIGRGTYSITFLHGPEHQRIAGIRSNGGSVYNTTWYVEGPGGIVSEYLSDSPGYQHTSYLMAAGGLVGMRVERWNWGGGSPSSTTTRYLHKDHLGSIAVITNEAGAVVERLSYDAWGKRRQPNGADDPAGAITSQTTRGFTGHEELDTVGLVHMNGRVYDPLLARFASADPMTESPFSTQGWNRYSYVGNSPLNFTDPSGYCFMGCFWQSAFRAIGNFFRQNWGGILQFAVSAVCNASVLCAPFLPIVAGLTSAIITGVTSGKLGLALRAGFFTAITVGIAQYASQFAAELGGGLGVEGSPVSASTSDPSTWGPRMDLGGTVQVCTVNPMVCDPPNLPASGAGTAGVGAGVGAAAMSASAVGAPSAWSYVSGPLHLGLMAGSFLPSFFGSAFSLLDAGVHGLEGNRLNAGISLAAAGLGIFTNAGAVRAGLAAGGGIAARGFAGTIRNVNPLRGTMNCVACSIATDATLAGRPASALATGPTPISMLESMFQGRFVQMSNQAAIEAELLAAGNGARGIVFGSRGAGEIGHVFNGANQGGTIRFLDGQVGGTASFEGYRQFFFLRTN